MVTARIVWSIRYPNSSVTDFASQTKDVNNVVAWDTRIKDADKKVMEGTFPRLSILPIYQDRSPKQTPWRLYREMILVRRDEDDSISF